MTDRAHKPRHRGKGFLFGRQATETFLKDNNLSMIIRGHEDVEEGYTWHFNNKVLTIFSAPDYMKRGNSSAVLRVKGEKLKGFYLFKNHPKDKREKRSRLYKEIGGGGDAGHN